MGKLLLAAAVNAGTDILVTFNTKYYDPIMMEAWD